MMAIRGASTIKMNTEDEIKNASIELFSKVIDANKISLDEIVAVEFSCTKDVTKAYPGKFIREYFKLDHTAIMHFNEMDVDADLNGFIPLCIRLLLFIDRKNNIGKFIYLNGAKRLRKDLLDE